MQYLSLFKNWKVIIAILCILAAGGIGLYISHLQNRNDALKAENSVKDETIAAQQASIESARKARQVKESNVKKANIPDADVITALAGKQWLRD